MLKPLQAEDFNTYSVSVDGATRGIQGDVVNGKVRLYHELDGENPKYWYHQKKVGENWVFEYSAEPVNGCITGIPYKQGDYTTLADLQTAAGRINGAGSNTMVIVATPVDPEDLWAGLNLTVTLNGVQTWNGAVSTTGSGMDKDEITQYVYLQSHWGSGVKFTSATIVSA